MNINKTLAVILLAALISISFPAFTLAQTKTFTLDADFNEGNLLNINLDVPDQLALNPAEDAEPFPFINVAASGRGTIVRLNTLTGDIVGEYWTAPNGRGRNPSRTTVDLEGNVWCGNRDETINMGSVVKIGLIVGGTRVDADGTANPTGKYLAPPYDYNTCVDRDGDGLIKTSIGLGDILPWLNSGGADNNGGVTTAEDEAITIYKRVAGTGVRHVSVDGDNNVWVGGYFNNEFELLDGDTGAVLASFDVGMGGYGGLVDGNGVIWASSRNPMGLLRYDTNTDTATLMGLSEAYGLGIDGFGNVWHSRFSQSTVVKYSPAGVVLGTYAVGLGARGVAVTPLDNNVWVANSSHNTVSRITNLGATVATIPVGAMPTGVAVDAEGKVWVTNYGSDNVMRIDPATDAVDLTVSLGANAHPYNYSDMTGIVVLAATASQGSWQVVYDTGVVGAQALEAMWNADTPDGTSIIVEARAATDEAGLGSVPFVEIANGADPGLLGQFVEIKVTFNREPEGENTPVLYDLTLEYNHPPVAVAKDITLSADENCQGTATADDINDGSYDPDDDPITLAISPEGPYELGETEVTLTVTDDQGESATDTAIITVVDDTPAIVTVGDMGELWPPNHKYVTITLADLGIEVWDNCDGMVDINEVGSIMSVYSDEPEDAIGNGDGKTTDDIIIVDCCTLKLRAERQGNSNTQAQGKHQQKAKGEPGPRGNSNGRVYGITFIVTDAAGNVTTNMVYVGVPKSQASGPAIDDGPDAGYTVNR